MAEDPGGSGAGDWEDEVEAFRDRQKLKQVQSDRLMAAGFDAEQVAKMRDGGQRAEELVRWSKVGDTREWDKGKTVVDDVR